MKRSKYGYMCLTDFEWELGEACGGTTIYPSEEDLRKNCKCVNGYCGIVKVKISFEELIKDYDESKLDECDV